MSLTLKQMLDEVLLLSGVDTETSYVDQGTAEVERLVSLANRSASDLALYPWQGLRSRYTFTLTTDTEYALPADYLAFIPNTMYANGEVIRADFPTETGMWSYLQASSGATGARYQMRLLDNMIQVFQPDSGQVMSFEYQSKYPVLSSGGTAKQRFTADTDTFRLDDELLIRDVLWRYKKLVGEPDWQVDLADFRKYEGYVKGQDKSAQTLQPCDGYGAYGEPYYNLWRPVPNV